MPRCKQNTAKYVLKMPKKDQKTPKRPTFTNFFIHFVQTLPPPWLVHSFEINNTRRYGPLCGPTSSSCGGHRPSAEAFFALRQKKEVVMLFGPIFGNFWCPVVTLVTFSSNISNFERNPKNQKNTKKNQKNQKNRKKFTNPKKFKKSRRIQKKIQKNTKKS